MAVTRDPRSRSTGSEYSYRRDLSLRELLPAVGVGVGVAVGAGLVAFYVARLLLQRTPLRVDRSTPLLPSHVER